MLLYTLCANLYYKKPCSFTHLPLPCVAEEFNLMRRRELPFPVLVQPVKVSCELKLLNGRHEIYETKK